MNANTEFLKLNQQDAADLLDVVLKTGEECLVSEEKTEDSQVLSLRSICKNNHVLEIVFNGVVKLEGKNSHCLMHFKHAAVSYLAKIENCRIQDRRLHGEIHFLYKCERRESYRLKELSSDSYLMIQDEQFLLHDLSLSGACIKVPQSLYLILKDTTLFQNCLLMFEDHHFQIESLQIVHIKELSGGSFLVGVTFNNFDKKDEAKLFRLINETLFRSKQLD